MASSSAQAAILQRSEPVPDAFPKVVGPNLDEPQSIESLLASYANVGFQASAVSQACDIIERMVSFPLS